MRDSQAKEAAPAKELADCPAKSPRRYAAKKRQARRLPASGKRRSVFLSNIVRYTDREACG